MSATIFPGRYIQGYGVIRRLGPEIARLGKFAFIFCSNTVYEKVLPVYRGNMKRVLENLLAK